MKIEAFKEGFSVCQVNEYLPSGFNSDIYFACQTDEEKSLVCKTIDAPGNCLAREDGWRGFRICGALDFSLIGIISKISSLLAENGIGIFVVSTYRTDYFFVKELSYEKAKQVLKKAGYSVCVEGEENNYD